VQQERVRELASLEDGLRTQYYESLVGRKLRVLVESNVDERSSGTSCRYATVEMPAHTADKGHFVDVIAADVVADRIVAG
jgi:tRNA A37 methylthiotransferase MiaB